MIRFFIDRPVLAAVLSILITLAGLLAMHALPVAQYPNILPTEIVVNALYPGASADLLASTVAAPLEEQINGATNMLYMQSTSSNSGILNLSVIFEIGTDPETAAIEVNNRVQVATAKLPEEVRRLGVTVRKKSSALLQVFTLAAKDAVYNATYMSNYALLNIVDELKRVEGIGDITIFGAREYAMRVWIRPDLLKQHQLTIEDVTRAIREQNHAYAVGELAQPPLETAQAYTYNITSKGRLSTTADFENILLHVKPDGAQLCLKDVARIELGALYENLTATYNGVPAVAIGVYLQPGANALAAVAAVNAKMEELANFFPTGLFHATPFNTTKFVQASIHEVIITFIEAILLVMIVVYLFLQNVRATLIPIIAVPVSLIGTFAGMYLLGFSINLLTLFGLVLAIGIVVDDAIIVLENIERLMTQAKLSARQAAQQAMEQVTGPVIAIVLVLCAVFVPIGFMGGLTGEMYKQFAITIAISVIISGFVALTLTPAICVLLLKHTHTTTPRYLQFFNRRFDRLTQWYMRGVALLLRYSKSSLAFFSLLLVVTAMLYRAVPTSLVPEEDQGFAFVMAALLPGASLPRTEAVMQKVNQRMLHDSSVSEIVSFSGLDLFSGTLKSNAGISFVSLQEWQQRQAPEQDARYFVRKMITTTQDIKDAFVVAFNPPPIMGMSTTGGFECYLQNRSGASTAEIVAMGQQLLQAARQVPALAQLRTTTSVQLPQYNVQIDLVKAKACGVTLPIIFATMQSLLGGYYVNDFTLFGRSYQVKVQAEANFRSQPDDLRYFYVRAQSGKLLPLNSLVTLERTVSSDMMERFNAFPAIKMMGNAASGYSSGQAIAALEAAAKQVLPANYTLAWTGSAYQEKAAHGSGSTIFLYGLIMVFLVLAALYEKWSLPLSVLLTVPFALFGALLAIWLRGLNNDVYFQIGMVTLIGLAAKNAILIVEFALLRRAAGVSLDEAVLEAARLRFRPIVMTSLAFILGCVPLAISTGAGAASRHSIGTGVIGGMLAATVLAALFTPLFFKLIVQTTEQLFGKAPQPEINHEL